MGVKESVRLLPFFPRGPSKLGEEGNRTLKYEVKSVSHFPFIFQSLLCLMIKGDKLEEGKVSGCEAGCAHTISWHRDNWLALGQVGLVRSILG